HRACWLALPNQAVPAGLEPATVWLTASRTTVVLRDSKARRTEQESNLNEAGTRLTQGPMTSAPGRTPTLSGSSGGWGRASGRRVFSAALLPSELLRNEQETLVGVEPTSCDLQIAASPLDHRIIQSRRGDSNPLGPRYEGGARPVEHRRHLFRAASVGVEPTRPRFRASVPCRGPGQKAIQSQWRGGSPRPPPHTTRGA